MIRINRLKRHFACFLINHFFLGTHFFSIKRALLIFGGIPCGKGSKMVGPIYIGGVSKLSIGENVWIGKNISILGNGEVVLGNNIDIAPEVAFTTGSHNISSDMNRRAGEGVSFKIVVEDGTWIGVRTTIMGNTTIGKGAVIGACSLVNKDISGDGVYVGIPVKLIKRLQ